MAISFRKIARSTLLPMLLLGVGFCFGQQTPPVTLNKILESYITALGGAQALAQMKTLEIHFRHSGGLGPFMRTNSVYYWAAPNKVAQETKSGPNQSGSTYNGKEGWLLNPRGKPKRLPADRLAELQRRANPLRYTRLPELYPGAAVDHDVVKEGKTMHVVRAPIRNGEMRFYFDAESHLLAAVEESHKGAVRPVTTRYSDYKKADGLLFPFRIEEEADTPQIETDVMKVGKVRINPDLKPSIFELPRR